MATTAAIEAARAAGTSAAMLAVLHEIRVAEIRRPDVVAEFGQELLNRGAISGDEGFDALEQIAIAALDTDNGPLAELCMTRLESKFPKSRRVVRLRIMMLEALGDFESAEAGCVLHEDACDPEIMKRLVSVRKAQGDVVGAIEALNEYLEVQQTDLGAWLELGALFISVHDFKAAAFCYEEAIVLQPHNYAHHLVYAETLHTAGEYAAALAHYSQAIELNPACARAYTGLIVLLMSAFASSQNREHHDLLAHARSKLAALYCKGKPEVAALAARAYE
eukprot:Amastigsp_a174646_231.p1 type:complete len:278 gc:universal Amastigsp_a174646_231:35-868(+)